MLRAARSNWGSGETLHVLVPSVKSLGLLGMSERMCASPGMARVTVESVFRIDVRAVLPTIDVPTLVIHATDDPIPVQGGRYLADHIPGARLVEVDGHDHAPWTNDPDRITRTIEEFLTGTHAPSRQSQRALKTVLFTDIVSSTARAAAIGDERWSTLLQRFGEVTTDLAERFGGTVVKSTGDGHLATFEGPTYAIRCAEALRSDAEALDIEIRTGVHTGECELIGDDIGGIAVHIARADHVFRRAGRNPRLQLSTRSRRRLRHRLRRPRFTRTQGRAGTMATPRGQPERPTAGIVRSNTRVARDAVATECHASLRPCRRQPGSPHPMAAARLRTPRTVSHQQLTSIWW